MNAPLSLFLTHFTAEPSPVEFEELLDEPVESEPVVTLLVADLEAQVEAAAQAARSECQEQHEAEMAALVAAQEEAAAEALAAARTEWIESAGESLTSGLDTAMAGLRTILADRVAAVLKPLLSELVLQRTKAELIDAIDRLLADPTQPMLRIRGPEDLGAALRDARPDAGIEWIVADVLEVAIIADATHIETKLAAALADIAGTGN